MQSRQIIALREATIPGLSCESPQNAHANGISSVAVAVGSMRLNLGAVGLSLSMTRIWTWSPTNS